MIEEYIEYIGNNIIDDVEDTEIINNLPFHPVVIVYFDEKTAKKVNQGLYDTIKSVWPRYIEKVRCIRISINEITDYDEIIVNDVISGDRLNLTDVLDDIYQDNQMVNLNKIVFNCIVDSSLFNSIDIMNRYNDCIRSISDIIDNDGLWTFYYLLDERIGRKRGATYIKENLADSEKKGNTVSVILSNKLQSNAVISKNDERDKMVGSLITVSNTVDRINDFFTNKVLSVQYIKLEKNNAILSHAIISGIITKIMNRCETYDNSMVLGKIGLVPGATFDLLSKYVEEYIRYRNIRLETIIDNLPRRRECIGMEITRNSTTLEIDEITMGSWTATLDSLPYDFIDFISNNRIYADYKDYLYANFNIFELDYIYSHYESICDEINRHFTYVDKGTPIGRIWTIIILNHIAQNKEVNKPFFDAIKDAAHRGDECVAKLKQLRSENYVADDDISNYYKTMTERFLDDNVHYIDSVIKATSVRQFEDCLKNLILRLVQTEFFGLDLSGVLRNMCREDMGQINNYLYDIINNRIHNYQYIKTYMTLANPVISAVLMKNDGFHDIVRRALDDRYSIVESTNKNRIEAYKVYSISDDDLRL